MNNYKTKTEYEHTLESAIATVGAAIADISRVKILCALMDGIVINIISHRNATFKYYYLCYILMYWPQCG